MNLRWNRGMRYEVRGEKTKISSLFRSCQTPNSKPQTRYSNFRHPPITIHQPPNIALRPRAELASRSDTGLRKQTGEGEAFTGGGMSLPPKKESVPVFCHGLRFSKGSCSSQ